MKRLIRIIVICSFLLASFAMAPGLAAPNDPPANFLPLFMNGGTVPRHTVSGSVVDSDGFPVSNVVIRDVRGMLAVTDSDGEYAIRVVEGDNTLTAERSGYSIPERSLTVATDLTEVNFDAQVGCGNIVVNESINVGAGGWDFITTGFDATVFAGTDTTIFYSTPSSGRTGIDPALAVNELSDSKARSQVYHVPSDADTAFMGLWVYQLATGVPGEGDHQYIEILDEGNVVQDTLLFANANTAAWNYIEFPLESYIGDSIKIQIRTLNDGSGGVSAMYFDDVMLVICNAHCESQVINGDMETAGTGWFYHGVQVVPPVYSTLYNHSLGGSWSLQTGIPLGGIDQASTSEAFQDVNLPSSHKGALLTFWLLTTRDDMGIPVVDGLSAAEFPAIEAVPMAPSLRSPTVIEAVNTPDEDWVYVYIFDEETDELTRLLWEEASHWPNWERYSFDVSDWLGKDIELLFGTYNDGLDGPSALYVDDVVLGTCP